MAKNDVTFKMTGLREMERNLLDLAEEFGPRNARTTLNAPMKSAMAIVEDDIRANTPVATGFLVGTVKQKSGKPRKTQLAELKNPNLVAFRSAGWLGANFHQMIAVEYGTRKNPEGRIIRGALEDNASQVLQTLREGWEASMAKTVARLNKRKKLGKLKIR